MLEKSYLFIYLFSVEINTNAVSLALYLLHVIRLKGDKDAF